MLRQHGPVIRGEHDQRVVPQPQVVERVEYPAHPVVRHREQSGVALPDVLDGFRGFVDLVVAGPVVERSVVIVAVHGAVFFGAIEGLVGIEDLDLQEPVVGRPVGIQPLDGRLRGLRTREVFLPLLEFPVAEILLAELPQVVRQGHAVHVGRPPVVLLAAEEIPGVERRMVVLAA